MSRWRKPQLQFSAGFGVAEVTAQSSEANRCTGNVAGPQHSDFRLIPGAGVKF
jgi:hypothetical protein